MNIVLLCDFLSLILLFEEGNNQDIVGGICRKVEQRQAGNDGDARLPHHFEFGTMFQEALFQTAWATQLAITYKHQNKTNN